MTDPTALERGRERLREVHGERSFATRGTGAIPCDVIVEVAYGDVYSRPGLSLRERQIASVAALVATGRSSQLPVHLRSSLKAGLTPEELQEVIIQTATIAGFPPAMNAWSQLKTIVGDGPEPDRERLLPARVVRHGEGAEAVLDEVLDVGVIAVIQPALAAQV